MPAVAWAMGGLIAPQRFVIGINFHAYIQHSNKPKSLLAYLATAPVTATSFLALEDPILVNGIVYFVANPLTFGLYIFIMSMKVYVCVRCVWP